MTHSGNNAHSTFSTLKHVFWALIRFVFYLSLIIIVIGSGAVIGGVKTFSRQLPEIGYHTYKPSINTKVYDRHGNLMTEFHQVENRKEKVPLARIPEAMQQAIIAIEDGRFYRHYGVDPIRIIAAMLQNLRSGRITGGASTITQQLARNAFLTFERTYSRKIKEVLLAFKIEKTFTKNEILELYLNEIYFGHGAWGIASAASVYFGKRTEDLTLPECAILAGLPKNPRDYDPYRKPKRAKGRQVLVLNMMMENGFITETQAREAKDAPLTLSSGKTSNRQSSYFIEYIRNELIERFGEKRVYTEGLKVYTTFDPDMQRAGEEAFAEAPIFKEKPLRTHPTLQGGLLAMDPTTGHIRAMVGGRDFKQSEFNRATQARRQPGSSIKPVLYLSAIDSGITAAELFIDEPLEIVNKYSGSVWAPKNYGNHYEGPVTMKEALVKSLNTIAVKIIQRLSPQKMISYARMLGITSPMGPHLSLSLGALDVTLLDMTIAYATIANEGVRVEPRAILRVVDHAGNVIWRERYSGEQVLDASSCYVLIDMLRDVVRRGTGTRAKINRPCAGKTGTTNNYIDAWFCGFTPDLVACTYVGHDDRQPLGARMAGGTVAGPIWKLFMEKALKDVPAADFRVPNNVITKNICRDSGFLPSRFCDRTMDMIFRRGTEPDEVCESHMVTESAENYFDADGSIIVRPHVVTNDTGNRIETEEALEAAPTPVQRIPTADGGTSKTQRSSDSDERRSSNRRTRFQNRHNDPFKDMNFD